MLPGSRPEDLARYLDVGRSAVDCIAEALVVGGLSDPLSVLDFGCGYGRVLRHLLTFLPEAEIVASDVDTARVEFCEKAFGAAGVVAARDPQEASFDRSFDLIWAGSCVTHLDAERFRSAFELLARSLGEQGIAVVTLHGRYAVEHQRRGFHYLAEDAFREASEGLQARGFGYAEYEPGAGYGVSLSSPQYVVSLLEAIPDIRLLGYHERAWDDHQDVVVFGRPRWDA